MVPLEALWWQKIQGSPHYLAVSVVGGGGRRGSTYIVVFHFVDVHVFGVIMDAGIHPSGHNIFAPEFLLSVFSDRVVRGGVKSYCWGIYPLFHCE